MRLPSAGLFILSADWLGKVAAEGLLRNWLVEEVLGAGSLVAGFGPKNELLFPEVEFGAKRLFTGAGAAG